MNTKFPLASVAGLIADPARAAMLTALLDERSRSAGELALAANVSAQSASMHLAQLLEGGMLVVTREGRHRFYRIARPEVAHAIEALGAISTAGRYLPSGANQALCSARTCYDHLAGAFGVRLTEALEGKGMLAAKGRREFDVTPRGEQLLASWSIDVGELRSARRSFARRCLDWTERRDHLAGAVGAAICQRFLETKWIRRDRHSRAIHVSAEGERELARLLA
jgi:DNA-binding transcriptional ArsR family regulator